MSYKQLIQPDLNVLGRRAYCLQTCRVIFGQGDDKIAFGSARKNYDWLKLNGNILDTRPAGVYCLAWFELPNPDGDVIVVGPDGKGYGSPHKSDPLDANGWGKLRVYTDVNQASAQRGVGKLLGYSVIVEKIPVAEYTADLLSLEEIAAEVRRGDWGNGQDRKNRLTAAGYDYQTVQDQVNAITPAASASAAPVSNIGKSWTPKGLPLALYASAESTIALSPSKTPRTYTILAEQGARGQIANENFDITDHKVWVNLSDGVIK